MGTWRMRFTTSRPSAPAPPAPPAPAPADFKLSRTCSKGVLPECRSMFLAVGDGAPAQPGPPADGCAGPMGTPLRPTSAPAAAAAAGTPALPAGKASATPPGPDVGPLGWSAIWFLRRLISLRRLLISCDKRGGRASER